VPRLLRRGVISVERLQDVVPLALMDDEDSDDVPADAADEVPADVPDAVPEDFPGDAGVSDEARGVAPGGAGEAQVAGEMAPGDAAGDGEDAAEQVKHVHGDAAE
jgi:hypothetical protein